MIKTNKVWKEEKNVRARTEAQETDAAAVDSGQPKTLQHCAVWCSIPLRKTN
jgi:hypothetical protein